MKLMLAAIALTIASPALAQTAPANTHADHAAHTAQVAPVEHSARGAVSSADPHAGHDMSPAADHAGHGAGNQ